MDKYHIPRRENLLTVVEVAEIFGVDPQTIRKWVKAGKFPQPSILYRNPQYWRKEEVLSYLDK